MKFILYITILLVSISNLLSQSANEYYENARLKFNQKDFKAALKDIDKASALDSSNTYILNFKAQILFDLKEYQESFDLYTQTIAQYPNSESYSGRAILFETIGEYKYALDDYTSAIVKAENDTILQYAYSNRGAYKMRMRNFNAAYDDLKIAYQMDSTNLFVLTNLGAASDEIGKGEETFKYLFKAIEIDSTFYASYVNVGFKYQQLGEYNKAIQFFDKALKLEPNEPLSYSNRAFNYYKLGDLKKAHQDIDKSLELFPSNSYAYRTKALIYIQEGKNKKACENIQLSLDYGFTLNYGDEVLDLQKEHCE